jgi:hypothetical protein
MTMVAGQIVVGDGKLLTTNLPELIDIAKACVSDVFHRRVIWLSTHRAMNELQVE